MAPETNDTATEVAEERGTKLVNLPIWGVHGAEDTVVPAGKSMVDALTELGAPPRFTLLHDVRHDTI